MENKVIIFLSFLAALYLLYKFLFRTNKRFEKEINEILTSKEYKVKGQYER